MTEGPILGAKFNQGAVYTLMEKLGYDTSTNIIHPHREHMKLSIQIHSPAFFKDIENVVTEIEFDVKNGHLSDMVTKDMLRQFHELMPGTLCRETYMAEPSVIQTIPQYLKRLCDAK